MPIHTVLGPIEPDELGPTGMHEHLLCDTGVWHTPPANEPPPAEGGVTMENLGFLRWNILGMKENLGLNDPAIATAELKRAAGAGASGLVELTVVGMDRRVAELPAISRAANVHVMVGCGFYVHDVHPDWLTDASVDEIASSLIDELTNGLDRTKIIPALIGEIGTSEPVTDRERKVVTAAARAGAETGTSVNVHLDPRGSRALELMRIMLDEGMPAERVVFSHLDERLDRGYHKEIAESGAVLEYDTFGSEFYFGDGLWKDPTDAERLDYVEWLVSEGYVSQLVVSSDVWMKAALRTYGGMGYEHVFLRIKPALATQLGMSDAQIDEIYVNTPRRLLNRP